MKINYKNLNHIEFELKKFKDSGLLIVTKNQKIDEIKELILKGYKIFGENRVQEALQKYSGLSNPNNIELHLIGPLQTNKVKSALQLFDVIQSIDRISLVDSIVKKINSLEKTRTKEFYIQVNIGEEYQKGGVRPTTGRRVPRLRARHLVLLLDLVTPLVALLGRTRLLLA